MHISEQCSPSLLTRRLGVITSAVAVTTLQLYTPELSCPDGLQGASNSRQLKLLSFTVCTSLGFGCICILPTFICTNMQELVCQTLFGVSQSVASICFRILAYAPSTSALLYLAALQYFNLIPRCLLDSCTQGWSRISASLAVIAHAIGSCCCSSM